MSESDYFPGETADGYVNAKLLTLSPQFLDVAACPACHAKLAIDYGAEALVCTRPTCGLVYPVREGVPILLIDEASHPSFNREETSDLFSA